MQRFILIFLLAIFIASCGGSDPTPPSTTNKTLVSIQIAAAVSVEMGRTHAMMATANYSDGSNSDVTQLATWSSSADTIASIDSTSGVVSALAVGTAVITANYQNRVSNSVNINVIAAASITELTISNTINLKIDIAETVNLVAVAKFSNGSSLLIGQAGTWSSSNTGIASIATGSNVITGIAPGTTMVSVTYDGLTSAEVAINVVTLDLVEISNAAAIPVGGSVNLLATAKFTDGSSNIVTNQAIWNSSDPEFAEVDVEGIVTGKSVGTSLITATYQGKSSLSVTIDVITYINIAAANIVEGNSGTSLLTFTVSVDSPSPNIISIQYETADGSATADTQTVVSDYVAIPTTNLQIPANSLTTTISVVVNGDTDAEENETLTVSLSNPVGVVAGNNMIATGTIIDDDATFVLNDTGVTTCSDGNFISITTCPQTTALGQDAAYGRDATLNDDTDGHAGFSFTQVAADGSAINPASTDYTVTPWSCVTDNVTGLMWEIKTTNGGLQDTNHTYSWFNSTGTNDGGDPGAENGGTGNALCVDTTNCDTEKYVAQVNAIALCGFSDWRLPSLLELTSITDLSFSRVVDSGYFPNITPAITVNYWTSTPYAYTNNNLLAFFIDFRSGQSDRSVKSAGFSTRLVRAVK